MATDSGLLESIFTIGLKSISRSVSKGIVGPVLSLLGNGIIIDGHCQPITFLML